MSKLKKHFRMTEAGVDLVELAERFNSGRSLSTAERRQIFEILLDVAQGADFSDMVIPLEGASPSDRPVMAVVDLLTEDDYETQKKKALGRIAERWAMKEETLRSHVRTYRIDATHLIETLGVSRAKSAAEIIRERLVAN